MDIKAQIRATLKIEDIIGRTVELKRHGNYLTGFCPFHQNTNTPAFVVWPSSQTWRCFGACGEGGDIFSFVMKRDNLSFEEALDTLAREANLDLKPARLLSTDRQPRQANWQSSLLSLCDQLAANLFTKAGEKARCWLNQRGLADATLKRFRVGFNPASQQYGPHYLYSGITIPHYHQAGQTLWGVKIRLSQEGQSTWLQHWQRSNPDKPLPKKLPKYVSVKGTQQSLFNGDDLPADTVLICEGEFDVMLAWQELRDLVTPISLGSATSRLSYQWIRYTLPTRCFLLALDGDKAGQQSRRIWQGIVNERGLDVLLPSGQDLTDYYQSGHNLRDLLLPLLQSDKPSLDFPLVIRWPAEAEIATIGGQWRRLPDGQLEATYANAEELKLCLEITRCIRSEEATLGEWSGSK
ncbi:MAG: hypothetical protein DPW09_22190 [Anaerolineae bacterium]|nr:hypothetical protein [Anaerolineae bacterium]